ncbi:MAG: carbohydrate ABC transporter permease [Bauldia sp.]|uniref:carbohydrate ABC transporter permease n=1 Tax=Bauldia sp. TaxID=2575872 RepID=UPI001E0F5488|nr:carbohydrate ABC transporter permease [Bauldia sp.]MCB1494200.1 carbohydrate ABC transporter permease [Bauldia sp.]
MATLSSTRPSRFTMLSAGILFVGVVAPLMMAITISLNPDEQRILVDMGTWRAFIPTVISGQNYVEVWTDPVHPFLRYLFNTTFITLTTLILSILINSMAAFVLAQGTVGGRKLLIAIILATLVVPAESLVLPQLIMASRAGIIDSYEVQILPGVANAMAIFLFYQFFSRLPRDLIEAARVDGFSFFQIYRHIAMPLSKPVVSAIAVLQFLEIWNSYLWPVMVTRGPEVRPLSVAMSAYFGTNQAAWGNIMAFAVSMAIPVILFFLLLQKQFIASVVSSGVKG